MLLAYDKPTIKYVVEEAVASGIEDIITVIGRHKRSIENHFDKYYELEYNLQKAGMTVNLNRSEKSPTLQTSTIQAKILEMLSSAERHISGELFAVLLRDSITRGPTPCTKQLIDIYNKYGASAISVEEVPPDKVERHSIINGKKAEDSIYKITELVEKPPRDKTPSNLTIWTDTYSHQTYLTINETEPGAGGEIQLTDALQKLDSIYGATFKSKTYDLGNRLDRIKISIEFALDDDFKDDLVSYMKSYI